MLQFQLLPSAFSSSAPARPGCFHAAVPPVSYTHLDVYKRQTDTSGIIVTYYHTPLDYIESYSISFQDLLSGYSISRSSTIVITSGDKVIASNEEKLEGTDIKDIEVLQNINKKAVSGQMVHVHNTVSSPKHVFGMLDLSLIHI